MDNMPWQELSQAPFVSCLSRATERGMAFTNIRFLAYGIFHINSGSLYNWQYLFIIEGAATCAVAIVACFLLPTGPGSAWFLSKEERVFAVERMRRDNALFVQHDYAEDGLEEDRLTKRDLVEAAKDWKLWYVLVFNICASLPTQAFSVFMPLVVKGLGYSSIEANLVRD